MKDVKDIKDINEEVNKILVPLLKDNIFYSNKQNKRLYILNVISLIIILAVALFSGYLIYKQNIKYQEFLSQFEFEKEETVYQDLDSGEGDIINPTLTNGK